MNDLLQAIWLTLKFTPWYVYLIFFYCLFIGLKCTKDGVVSIYKMMIIPVVFVCLSLESLFTNFKLDALLVYGYVGALILGVLLGALQGKLQNVSVDNDKKLIAIPGTWSTFFIIMVIFCSKYYLSYALQSDPALTVNTHFELGFLAVSGVTAGLFLGRTVYYWWMMVKGPWVELTETD